MRFDYRHKDGDWLLAGTLKIIPKTAGLAEQIELRGILIRKNKPVGEFSDTKTALIAP
jgi:hypothetical protein